LRCFFVEANQTFGDTAFPGFILGRAIILPTCCSLWCAQNVDSNGAY